MSECKHHTFTMLNDRSYWYCEFCGITEVRFLENRIAELEARPAKPGTEEILLTLSRDHAYVNLEYDDRYGWCVYTRKSWSSEHDVKCGTEEDSPLLALRNKLEGK